MKTIKVSSKTSTKDLAGSLASTMRRERELEVECIGAGAVNQAVKGIAIARGYVAPNGIDLTVIPYFSDFEVPDKRDEVTGITFKLQRA